VTLKATLPQGGPAGGRATVVIRPEHAAIAPPGGDDGMAGIVENIVYSGVDTQFHVRLASGSMFLVRAANRRDASPAQAPGEPVVITVQDGAAQVVRDR